MNDSNDARAVFLSVARCPNVTLCLESNAPHACREVVMNQMDSSGILSYSNFQVPEPWVGELDVAPILFVSSNPSIGEDRHALGASSDETLYDSHHFAFGGGKRSYILDGIYTTTTSGDKLKKVAYWVAVRARARELIPDAVPGRDYALTEVVHCKSTDEIGVASAAAECSQMHLDRVLAISPARVLIVVGKAARERLQGSEITGSSTIEEREIGGRRRLIVYLPHPASWNTGPRTLAGLFPAQMAQLRREANLTRSFSQRSESSVTQAAMFKGKHVQKQSKADPETATTFRLRIGRLVECKRAEMGATYLQLGEAAARETGRKAHAAGARDLCQGNRWVWPPYARAIMVFLCVPKAENLADEYETMQRSDGVTPRIK